MRPFARRFHWRAKAVALVAGVAAAGLSSCGTPDPRSEWLKGESGTVTRVTDGDTFALNTGQVVRLASIEAPAMGYRDREAQSFAEESRSALAKLVLGKEVTLYYPGLTSDRYDRALAHAYLTGTDTLINAEMVRTGNAWFRYYPDTAKGSEHFTLLEQEARAQNLGLWAQEDTPIITAAPTNLPDAGFVILTDEISSVSASEAECTAQLSESGLNLTYPRPQKRTGHKGSDCFSEGVSLEVRGWVYRNEMTTDYRNLNPVRPTP